jgi:hypothetical protein
MNDMSSISFLPTSLPVLSKMSFGIYSPRFKCASTTGCRPSYISRTLLPLSSGRTHPLIEAALARAPATSSSARRLAAAASGTSSFFASSRISKKSFFSSSITLSEAPLISDSKDARRSVVYLSPPTMPCLLIKCAGTFSRLVFVTSKK